MLGVNIQKRKTRSDGEAVYLISFIGDNTSLFLCHLNSDGQIKDTKFFGCKGSVERIVRAQALHEFNVWKQILMCHIDEYEFAPAAIMGSLPEYLIPISIKEQVTKLKS